MSVVAIPLSLVLGLLAADGAADGAVLRNPVAMLPVAAERVSLEAVPRLEKLDDSLRRAAMSLDDVALLDEARTTANLAAVREMGIACEVDDAPCLGKVAVLVEVDRLLVPIVRIDGETTILRLLVVDREGRRAEAGRSFAGAITADDARGLVREALEASRRGAAPTPIGPPTTTSSQPTPSSTDASLPSRAPPPALAVAPDSAAGDGWWLGRVGLVAGGAAVAVGAGIGAVIVEGQLERPEPWSEREGRLRLGQGLVAVAVTGGVLGVVGGVLLAVVE